MAQVFVHDSAASQGANAGGRIDLGGYQAGLSGYYTAAGIKGAFEAGTGNKGYLDLFTQASGSSLVTRMRIDGSGNVGIGTTTPSDLLSLAGTSPFLSLYNTTPATGNTFKLRSLSTGEFDILDPTGNSAFRVNAGGFAGIHSTPSSAQGIDLFADATTGATLGVRIQNNGAGRLLDVNNSGGTVATILNNGNFGIGTGAPGTGLDVLSPTGVTFRAPAAGVMYMYLKANNGATNANNWVVGALNAASDNRLSIQSAATGSWVENMVILPNGNTGLGTTAPQAKLDARGTIATSISDTQVVGKLYSSASDGFMELYTGDATPVSRVKLSAFGDSYLVPAGSGKLGIGTASPNAKLEISNNVSYEALRLTGSGVGNLVTMKFLGGAASDYAASLGSYYGDLRVNVGAVASPVAAMFVAGTTGGGVTAGNVGIGTTAPGYQLDVAGTVNAQEVRVNGVVLNPGTGSNWTVSGSDIYRNSGNVGIGVTGPGRKLVVGSGDTSMTTIQVVNTDSGVTASDGGYLATDDTNLYLGNQETNGLLTLFTDNDATKGLSIKNGNVGIGMTSPAYPLEIWNGNTSSIKLTRFLANALPVAHENIKSRGATVGAYAKVAAGDTLTSFRASGVADDNSTIARAARYDVSVPAGGVPGGGTTVAGDHLWYTTNIAGTEAERLRLTSEGNVGVGTPAPGNKVDIVQAGAALAQLRANNSATGGGGAYLQSTDQGQAILGGGVEYNGSAFVARAARAGMVSVNGAGQETGLNFFYDTGLTAGNTYTPTERMRIDTVGNVGIGTGSPDPNGLLTRLNVYGAATGRIEVTGGAADADRDQYLGYILQRRGADRRHSAAGRHPYRRAQSVHFRPDGQ